MSFESLEEQVYSPQLRQYSEYNQACQHLAQWLVAAIKKKPNLNLGLPTGRSAVELYASLSEKIKEEKTLDLSQLNTFNLDEYVGLEQSSPDSFRTFMHKHLFSKLSLATHQTHFPSPAKPSDYDREIDLHGGLDVCILGIGLNGHIAFNEPGSRIDSTTRMVELSPQTKAANRDQFSDPRSIPNHAVTMGIASILKAREIFLLCNNKQKWANLAPYIHRKQISPLFPASYLLHHPQVTILHL